MVKYKILIFIFILFSFNSLQAQKFNGAVILGFNAAQIDGDKLAGYHKLGLNAGLSISYDLSEPWAMNVDFSYSQRGSQDGLIPNDGEVLRKLTLNYLELPIYISYQDWFIEEENYYKVQAYTGLSLGRLFSVKNGLGDEDVDQDNFLKNDIGFLLGAKYFFSKHWGINGRYTRSLNKMYKHPEDGVKSLIGYFLNFGLIYKFL